MVKLKVLEWFGGIGAATQALKRINIPVEIIDYVELDKHAVKSYNAINGTNFIPTDINNVNVNNYGDVDLLIAGWPCQDYSVAGLGKGLDGTRSSLILLTIDKIRQMEIKPKYILLENVKGLLSKKHTQDLEFIKECFEELGYQWNQALLNSKYFNIPQSRERVFIVLTRKDLSQVKISHLEKINTVNKILKDILDFTEPTQTIELTKDNHLKFSNFITLPRASDGKLINGYHNRYWSAEKYCGTITASATPKIYFTNKMSQYNGKIIELDLNKLNNQERDKINKVAILGTLENDTFKDHSFNQKKHFLGINGITKTLRAGDCDSENKIIFKDVSFNQDKSLHGTGGGKSYPNNKRNSIQSKDSIWRSARQCYSL